MLTTLLVKKYADHIFMTFCNLSGKYCCCAKFGAATLFSLSSPLSPLSHPSLPAAASGWKLTFSIHPITVVSLTFWTSLWISSPLSDLNSSSFLKIIFFVSAIYFWFVCYTKLALSSFQLHMKSSHSSFPFCYLIICDNFDMVWERIQLVVR